MPLLALLLTTLTGVATATPSAHERAEYIRLSEELHKLAHRDAWGGVERFYRQLAGSALPLTFDDHVAGAHAAATRGDMAAARQRLMAAHKLFEHREVVEWLWNIDSDYANVDISTAAGQVLAMDDMPFDPRKSTAVTHAKQMIEEGGVFQGLLPAGSYRLGEHAFEVEPGMTMSVHVDPRQARRNASRRDRGS